MDLKERIEAFSKLGQRIQSLTEEEMSDLSQKALNQNPWFTSESVRTSLKGIAKMLDHGALNKWTSKYSLNKPQSKIVGIAMAGNIPLVGFHDFLSTLIAGHKPMIKLSSQDAQLLPALSRWLLEVEPRFASLIAFEEKLKGYDAAIATGSDNTSRYFEYYFKNVPHIIRKNRSSCAIIQGMESEEELKALGTDVFTYFGLGCRNIAKLFVPEEYDFNLMLKTWEQFGDIINHNKYANNYDYQRAIHLVNRIPFFDNGSVILLEDEKLVSPISVLYYERYTDQDDLASRLDRNRAKTQCFVSAKGWYKGSLSFGQAQFPEVDDYADDVDTLQFLSSLND
ncbi:MAG: acyl-CoA reductase [Cyclobacteriaceae bacterium]